MKTMLFTYDFETTGVNPKADRPVQIGLTVGLETPRIVMNQLVDPCMPISEGASSVHGITDNVIQGHPDFMMGLYTLFGLIEKMGSGSSVIIAGYNHQRFDNVMADTSYGQAIISTYPQLDIMRILRRYYPKLPSHKLGEAHQTLLGKELVGAHGAVQDCLGCCALLSFLLKDKNKKLSDLVEELLTPKVFDIMPIGKHKGMLVRDVAAHNPGWAKWMRTNAKDMDPDLSATVDYMMAGCPGDWK